MVSETIFNTDQAYTTVWNWKRNNEYF